jgi:hypothetical protein
MALHPCTRACPAPPMGVQYPQKIADLFSGRPQAAGQTEPMRLEGAKYQFKALQPFR